MKSIICNIEMGIRNHPIYITDENNNLIKTTQMPIDEISNFILNHQIYNVFLVGPKNFTRRIEEKTKEKELQKYSTTKINFNYIEGDYENEFIFN